MEHGHLELTSITALSTSLKWYTLMCSDSVHFSVKHTLSLHHLFTDTLSFQGCLVVYLFTCFSVLKRCYYFSPPKKFNTSSHMATAEATTCANNELMLKTGLWSQVLFSGVSSNELQVVHRSKKEGFFLRNGTFLCSLF